MTIKNKKYLVAVIAMTLTACITQSTSSISQAPATTLIAFDDDNHLQAKIQWTSYGVPHITADNLQSVAFGSGYAYANDNLCVLADQIIKVSSQRSKYFGPDSTFGNGDSANLISDFGYKALQLAQTVQTRYAGLSDNTRALVQGYVAGYNKYLAQTGLSNLAVECANQPWVKPITAKQLLTYLLSIARAASGAEKSLIQMAFAAAPGDNYLPYLASGVNDQTTTKLLTVPGANIPAIDLSKMNSKRLGSNAWALGHERTENGKGALLANPHFPHTGNLRFWQSHITIPGVLNVMGASLQGFPGAINIGFNDSISWSHTVTSARQFALYQLSMDPKNPLVYWVDDQPLQLDKRTFTIDVAIGDGNTLAYSKDYYYSHHGLMLEMPGPQSPFVWTKEVAFTLKDANENNLDLLDHWLAMNMADNLTEFKQSFIDHDGIPFTNTLYADKAGNTFYIDDSPVLNFNDQALALMATEPAIVAAREDYDLDVLPGHTALFDADGIVPYERVPKLQRNDYVQNANDSYWATNPSALMSNHPVNYGQTQSPLSLRTRMGLLMLSDSGGDDHKFSLAELEQALLSNRLYLSEIIKDSLLEQCQKQGDTPVMLGELAVDVKPACTALGNWNGKAGLDSRAAHVFREFAANFDHWAYLTTEFDVTDPANTPNTLAQDPAIMKTLAQAVINLTQAGFELDLTLGEIQFVEQALPDNTGGLRLPWAGGTSKEGGFNVFSNYNEDNETLLPKHNYPQLIDAITGNPMKSHLTAHGYQVLRGSSWMYVLSFTDEGPVARGLLASSQSAHSSSEFSSDQTRLYSNSVTLRPLYFNKEDIAKNTIKTLHLSSR